MQLLKMFCSVFAKLSCQAGLQSVILLSFIAKSETAKPDIAMDGFSIGHEFPLLEL